MILICVNFGLVKESPCSAPIEPVAIADNVVAIEDVPSPLEEEDSAPLVLESLKEMVSLHLRKYTTCSFLYIFLNF